MRDYIDKQEVYERRDSQTTIRHYFKQTIFQTIGLLNNGVPVNGLKRRARILVAIWCKNMNGGSP